MSRARDLADSADKDIAGTLTLDGLSVSGDVAVDTDTLFVDASADSVGIGTSSPSNKLSVSSGNIGLDNDWSINWGDGSVYLNANATSEYLRVITNHAERMRIDSSGNLLVGTTDPLAGIGGSTEEGVGISSGSYGGVIVVSRSNSTPMFINRQNNDGALIELRKDGTTVGSLQSSAGKLVVSSASVLKFQALSTNELNLDNTRLYPEADSGLDLGLSSNRFKDLYLSGGVYLGGTGSANHLDDYEVGLHTALLTCSTSGTITLSNDALSYTKIGRVVHLQGRLTVSSVSSPTGDIVLSLPFALANTAEDSARTVGYIQIQNATSNLNEFGFYATESGSTIPLVVTGGNTSEHSGLSAMAAEFSGDEFISINLTYITS
jgi:hypothetical protein